MSTGWPKARPGNKGHTIHRSASVYSPQSGQRALQRVGGKRLGLEFFAKFGISRTMSEAHSSSKGVDDKMMERVKERRKKSMMVTREEQAEWEKKRREQIESGKAKAIEIKHVGTVKKTERWIVGALRWLGFVS
jgi:hypothetical protein